MKSLCLVGGLLAVFALGACDAPVVGSWRSDKKLGNGLRNKMTVDSDYTGRATIYATPTYDLNQWIKFKFDIEWEDETERFDLHMDCDVGPCDGDDFRMRCEVIDEGDDKLIKLDCEGNKKWASYPFDWEEVIE